MLNPVSYLQAAEKFEQLYLQIQYSVFLEILFQPSKYSQLWRLQVATFSTFVEGKQMRIYGIMSVCITRDSKPFVLLRTFNCHMNRLIN